MKYNILMWVALTFSIATGVLGVVVFWWLKNGIMIVPDNRNEVEFWIACTILVIQLMAWGAFIIGMVRKERALLK